MHIAITGAGGFVGAGLVRRLAGPGAPWPFERLTLIDRHFAAVPDDPRIRLVTGDFGDAAVLDTVFATPVDVLFHLASVAGGQAEREFSLGWRVNLLALLALFERAVAQEKTARIVNASSIAVYGGQLPHTVRDTTPARPAMSYGAHKLATEIVLADLARRALADAVSLRLPGIVARPGLSAAHGSAFMSAVMRAAQAGVRYTCPVSPRATCWWMSLETCVDNLLHAAAGLDTGRLGAERVVTLPAVRLTVEAVLAALSRRFGAAATGGIDFAPDPAIEAAFGRMPALEAGTALELGFVNDVDGDGLVANALGD